MCTNFIVFFRMRIRFLCTNFVVFHQEEKDIVDMCTNIIRFLQEEKEVVDMCFSLRGERDCRHVY